MSDSPWITIVPLTPDFTQDKARVPLVYPGYSGVGNPGGGGGGNQFRVDSYFIIPSAIFVAPAVQNSASYLVGQYDYSASGRFTLKNLPTVSITGGFLCIRWRVGTTTYRYSLTDTTGAILYDIQGIMSISQRIPANFVIEAWVNPGQTSVVIIGDVTVFTSLRYWSSSDAPVVEAAPVDALNIFTDISSSIPQVHFNTNYWLNNSAA